MGVAGIAVAKQSPDTVYAAVGQSSESDGKILKTTNGGRTWSISSVSMPFGALESGRINGEPIAVSPHDINKVVVLTKGDGIYISDDGGESWNKSEAFPECGKTTGFVEFSVVDSDIIYVNVSGIGLYVSEDGGESWYLSEGSPETLRRVAQTRKGVLYCSASDGIWKYDGSWTKIYSCSDGAGIGGIDTDPDNDSHIVAVTSFAADGSTGLGNNHIIESTDGGKTFTDRYSDFEFIDVEPHFESKLTSSSSIVFDESGGGKMYVSDWFGIFMIENINSDTVKIYRNSQGIENTLAYCVKAVSGNYKIMSGLADINAMGWYDDTQLCELLTASLPQSSRIQDTTDIDYCISDDDYIVRVGAKFASDSQKYCGLEYSIDSGLSWNSISVPESFGYNAAPHIAVSSAVNEDETINLLMSGRNKLFYSGDSGATWQESAGAPELGHALYIYSSPIASDKSEKDVFYAYKSGNFYLSRDSGASFECVNTTLPSGLGQIEPLYGRAGELLLCVKGSGVFVSDDYGATFRTLGDFENPQSVCAGAGVDSTSYSFYVLESGDTEPGVYASDDQGNTWQKITGNTNYFSSISDMDADKETFGKIYIATSNRGVFVVER